MSGCASVGCDWSPWTQGGDVRRRHCVRCGYRDEIAPFTEDVLGDLRGLAKRFRKDSGRCRGCRHDTTDVLRDGDFMLEKCRRCQRVMCTVEVANE